MEKNMNITKIKLNLTSKAAKDATNALIKMHDAVSQTLSNTDNGLFIFYKVFKLILQSANFTNTTFYKTIERAHYYATETELDFKNIDDKINDALFCLLIEAKIAFDHFCNKRKDDETIQLLMITHFQATNELMKLSDYD